MASPDGEKNPITDEVWQRLSPLARSIISLIPLADFKLKLVRFGSIFIPIQDARGQRVDVTEKLSARHELRRQHSYKSDEEKGGEPK